MREYIARMEKRHHIDIVLVTISQSVEGRAAMEQVWACAPTDWEQNMQDLADDFWDENKYGYNKGFEGDGVLLLHNWYEGKTASICPPAAVWSVNSVYMTLTRCFTRWTTITPRIHTERTGLM